MDIPDSSWNVLHRSLHRLASLHSRRAHCMLKSLVKRPSKFSSIFIPQLSRHPSGLQAKALTTQPRRTMERQRSPPQGKQDQSKGKQKPQGKPQPSSKLRGRPQDSPEVRLSKTLSWVLRHGAQQEGLAMRSDGFVRVHDLVSLPRFILPNQLTDAGRSYEVVGFTEAQST